MVQYDYKCIMAYTAGRVKIIFCCTQETLFWRDKLPVDWDTGMAPLIYRHHDQNIDMMEQGHAKKKTTLGSYTSLSYMTIFM